jgi:hypothetical protein
MAADLADALQRSPAFPMLAFVSSPADFQSYTTGEVIKAGNIDIVSRLMFMQTMHKTYAGTGTICTGAAIKIPGSIAHAAVADADAKTLFNIGHPSGVIDVAVDVTVKNGEVKLARAAMSRTARRIMDGYVYIRR